MWTPPYLEPFKNPATKWIFAGGLLAIAIIVAVFE